MAKQRDKGINLTTSQKTTPWETSDFLEFAKNAIAQRGAEYNDTDDADGRERHMQGIVRAFNALTGHRLTIRQGWLFMVVLKTARAVNTDNPDTYIDMAAYAALAGEQRNA